MLQDTLWFTRETLRSDDRLRHLAEKHAWPALAKDLKVLLLRFDVNQPANLEHWLRQHKDAWESLKASELDIPAALHEILWKNMHE